VVRTDRGYLKVVSEVSGKAGEPEAFFCVPVEKVGGEFVETSRTRLYVPARELIEVVWPEYRRLRWSPF
jgi:hypothetical protein